MMRYYPIYDTAVSSTKTDLYRDNVMFIVDSVNSCV